MDFNIISGEIRNLRLIKLSIIIVELSAKIFLVSLVKKEGVRMGERFYTPFSHFASVIVNTPMYRLHR